MVIWFKIWDKCLLFLRTNAVLCRFTYLCTMCMLLIHLLKYMSSLSSLISCTFKPAGTPIICLAWLKFYNYTQIKDFIINPTLWRFKVGLKFSICQFWTEMLPMVINSDMLMALCCGLISQHWKKSFLNCTAEFYINSLLISQMSNDF